MAANKLYGIIYMSPLKLKLNIIDLKTQEIIETASSAVFVQEKHKSSIYRHELKKIVAALDGFLQLLKDYHIADYDFWANQQQHYKEPFTYMFNQIKSQMAQYKSDYLLQNDCNDGMLKTL